MHVLDRSQLRDTLEIKGGTSSCFIARCVLCYDGCYVTCHDFPDQKELSSLN
jgi:hypothetical protein